MSDDGAHAITVIAMLGNPFSPGYARARAQGRFVDALEFSTMHVAVYGPRAEAWALTERGARAVTREPESLGIGPSSMRWERDALVIRLDETTSPFPRLGRRPVRGTVRVVPRALHAPRVDLSPDARHAWWPVAPLARVEVDLDEPALRFRGSGYHDANAGDGALDDAFSGWTWSRRSLGDRARIHYDVSPRVGQRAPIALDLDASGATREIDPEPVARLATSAWGIERTARGQRGTTTARALEDTPFYARSLLATPGEDAARPTVHETLSLDRFRAPWVRFLLPFRMRRAS